VPYAFTLTTAIPASTQDIYDAWLNSLAHSEMTPARFGFSFTTTVVVAAKLTIVIGKNPHHFINATWRISGD
jgi:hypothetical protein